VTRAALWLFSWRTRFVALGFRACRVAIAFAFAATAFACLLAVKSDESKLPVGIVSISAKRKKKARINRVMDDYKGSYIWAYIIAFIACVAVAYYIVPSIVKYFFQNEEMDAYLTKMTVLSIFLILSVYGITWLLKIRAREGFVDSTPVSQWKAAIQNPDFDNVCSIYTEIYENQVKTEKGSPPNEITEEQARERVDADFTKKCSLGVFSCTLYQKVKASNDLDSIYGDLQTVPDSFLAQAYETLTVCKSILEKTIADIQDSISKIKIEGFDSPPVCSPDAAKSRKAAIEKSDPANDPSRCILLEEITPEVKNAAITQKLQKIQNALDALQGKGESFNELYQECITLKAKLAELKSKAESGTLVS